MKNINLQTRQQLNYSREYGRKTATLGKNYTLQTFSGGNEKILIGNFAKDFCNHNEKNKFNNLYLHGVA